jgi:phage terminase large subunit-like protein
MTKITDTKGIRHENGSRYEIKASKSAALQGIPVSVAIVDELHIVADSTWSALQVGLGGRSNAILIGISTAGDEDSHLLKRLYETADKAIAGEVDRFGAWIWEASSSEIPKDKDEFIKLLTEANPALQSGRADPENHYSDALLEPDVDVIRYRLNRFVNSSANSFIPFELWQKAERSIDDVLPPGQVVFAIDRTPNWEYATVAAAVKVGDEIHTELVASIVKPTLERLVYICAQLQAHHPRAIVMDTTFLRDLDKELQLRGIKSITYTTSQLCEAASTFYALIKQEKLKHAPDPLLSFQIPRTSRKNVGDGFKVSRKDSSIEIDGVMATVLACYGANTLPELELQVF